MDSSPIPTAGQPLQSSPLAQNAQQTPASEGLEVLPQAPANTTDGEGRTLGRTTSTSSTKVDPSPTAPSRNGTLKRNPSLRKRASLVRRSSSKRSLRAGSMKGLGDDADDGFNNVFHTPVPTTGNPTEILANRFQAWRKLLKDLITYFREIQTSYESRSKALLKISNVVNNTHTPPIFLSQGGLDGAISTLRSFHKASLTEANKAKDIEEDVITQLNGLRNDLTQKIKEIKSLSGDFKNSVDRERDNTRKLVATLQDALNASETDPSAASGKGDPFIVRLAVDRQVEKQIEEENYLHRAYLNLEGSGRELESIVVGEIQKAYNAYVGILRRETEHAHETIDDLRAGPIAMPKDHEWTHFVEHEEHFVNPDVPLRRLQDVYYPEKFNPQASEIRAGMLERKSKYLKSYTPGWYVLSPTHLHEFKSGDHIYTQQPVMSLYLLDQKLGSHSQSDGTSHKFSFKGRQTGAMHRGHAWVFRAESYDTMMAWYDAIKNLTEKTGAERHAFVRQHARSVSAGSHKPPSASSDGVEEDEADAQPFTANLPRQQEGALAPLKRPEPGGRFPSDLSVNRDLQVPNSPSSNGSQENSNAIATKAESNAIANQHHQQYSPIDDVVVARDHEPQVAATAVPSTPLEAQPTNNISETQHTYTTQNLPQATTEHAFVDPVVTARSKPEEPPQASNPSPAVYQTTESTEPTALVQTSNAQVEPTAPEQIEAPPPDAPLSTQHPATGLADRSELPSEETYPNSTSSLPSELHPNHAATGKVFYTDSRDNGTGAPSMTSPSSVELAVPGGFPGTNWSSWG